MKKFEKEMDKLTDIADNGAMMLCEGIARQAAVDYRQAVIQLWKLEHDPANAIKSIKSSEKWYLRRKEKGDAEVEIARQIRIARCKDTIIEVENFFNSAWFDAISDGMNGKWAFEKLKRLVDEEVRELQEKKKIRRSISMVNVEKKC